MAGKKSARVLETCLYVDDLDRARTFYERIFEFKVMAGDPRFCAFDAGGHVLLLFLRSASNQPNPLPWGVIPAHDGAGPAHIGFAIPAEGLDEWRATLSRESIPVESEFTWPGGGVSLYFRDPDAHLLELLTPGVWKNY